MCKVDEWTALDCFGYGRYARLDGSGGWDYMLMLVQPLTVMEPFPADPTKVLGPLDRLDMGMVEFEEPELDDKLVAELPEAEMTADA